MTRYRMLARIFVLLGFVGAAFGQKSIAFTAKPSTVSAGDAVVLRWEAPGAKSVVIVASGVGGIKKVLKASEETLTVNPQLDTRYTISAPESKYKSASILVTVTPKPTQESSPSPNASVDESSQAAPAKQSSTPAPAEPVPVKVTNQSAAVLAPKQEEAKLALADGILVPFPDLIAIILFSCVTVVFLVLAYMAFNRPQPESVSQDDSRIMPAIDDHVAELATRATEWRTLTGNLRKERDAAVSALRAASAQVPTAPTATPAAKPQVVSVQAPVASEPYYEEEVALPKKREPYAPISMTDTRDLEVEQDATEFSGDVVRDYNLARSMGAEGEFAFLRHYPQYSRLRCDNYDEVRSRPDLQPRFVEDDNGMFLVIEQQGKGLVLPYLDRDFSLTRKSLEGIYIYPEQAGGDLKLIRPAILDRTSLGWNWVSPGACGYRG